MIIRRIQRRLAQLSELLRRVEELQMAVGRIEMRQLMDRGHPAASLRDYEFRVSSQFGEDGIIQYLIHNITIPTPVFVEFGVQDYKESNTRFLLLNNNWTGLVLDSSATGINFIRKDHLYYTHTLRAVQAFIHRENINDLITANGISGDIGLLSIDIDGNDYWVWEALDAISPRIVICEYDNLLGCERAVVSPYDRSFEKLKAHYSFLYGGASLPALERLARKKGYTLVGSNSAGNNAFFVRNDVLGSIPPVTARETYVRARYRFSRDQRGNMTFLGPEKGLALIADLPLIDLETGATIRVGDLAPDGGHHT